MAGKPTASAYPDTMVRIIDGCCSPPEIGIMMEHPAITIIVVPGRDPAGFHTFIDQVKQGIMAIGKIHHFRRPVIHLRVDIHRVFTAPRRFKLLVPYSLQVRRVSAFPAGTDHQVPGILDVQGNQCRVIRRFLVGMKPLSGGQSVSHILTKVNGKPFVEGLIISCMFFFYLLPGRAFHLM